MRKPATHQVDSITSITTDHQGSHSKNFWKLFNANEIITFIIWKTTEKLSISQSIKKTTNTLKKISIGETRNIELLDIHSGEIKKHGQNYCPCDEAC